jgi:predicted permease
VKVFETRRVANGSLADFAVSGADFLAFAQRNRTLTTVGAILSQKLSVAADGTPVMVRGASVSAAMWTTLGVHPVAGRTFIDSEDLPGASVAVISELLQRRLFPGPPAAAIGKTLTIDGQPRVVVGVMPAGFAPAMIPGDVWIPLGVTPATVPPGANRVIELVGRLRPGVGVAHARADIARIAAELEKELPATHRGYGGSAEPLRTNVADTAQSVTLTLLAAVLFLLLLACANAINLALARTARRGPEISTRLALGASASSIVRQQLCESTLLGVIGGSLGVALAAIVLRPLLGLATGSSQILTLVRVDWRVMSLVMIVSVLTGVACGLMPALYGLRVAGGRALAGGGRRQLAGADDRRTRRLLMSAQVATAAVLLIGAIGMVATLRRLAKSDVGFASDGIVVADLSLSTSRYSTPSQRASFATALMERVATIPGIRQTAISSNRFVRGDVTQSVITIDGVEQRGDAPLAADLRRIAGDYFQSLKVPVISGRAFTPADRDSAPPVAIVNRSFVRKYLAGGEAIGKRVRRGAPTNPWLTIVGVVPDVTDRGVGIDVGPAIYVPYQQAPSPEFSFVLATSLGTAAIEQALRKEIGSLDANQAVDNIKPLPRLLSDSVGQEKFETVIITSLAVLALLLAATGIYGVTAFLVAERAREIAIRIALGAELRRVTVGVIADSGRWIVGGAIVGSLAGGAMSTLVRRYVPQVASATTSAYAGTVMFLVVLGIAASGVPAWRASRIAPATLLRGE